MCLTVSFMPLPPPRITGGSAKSILLKSPQTYDVRPSTDYIRQSVFSSLGTRVIGAHFLDLYAGTGAYGLEAFSRGAQSGVFVEKNPKVAAFLQENLNAVAKSARKVATACSICIQDALSFQPSGAFDLIFMDPPFAFFENPDFTERLLLLVSKWLKPTGSARILLEMPSAHTPPEKIVLGNLLLVKRLGKRLKTKPSVAVYQAVSV